MVKSLKDTNTSLLLRLWLLRALEADDQGHLERQLLGSIDDTLGNVIAAHDASEDVDEDALDLGVRYKDFERLLNGLGRGTAVLYVRQRVDIEGIASHTLQHQGS